MKKRPLGRLPTKGRLAVEVAQRQLVRLPKKLRVCVTSVEALREGMEVEREHQNVTKGAAGKTAKIAAVHLCERPDYYKRLKRFVEKK